MYCRTTLTHKFRTGLRFKQYDTILTERTISAEKNNQFLWRIKYASTIYKVLSYTIDLYFHDYKLTIDIDENRHSDRNIEYEKKRQKAIEQKIGWNISRIDPNKENLDIF